MTWISESYLEKVMTSYTIDMTWTDIPNANNLASERHILVIYFLTNGKIF